MLRLIVDSGSSIKESEKEKYGIDIIPIRIILGNDEYLDGINLERDVFYKYLINEKKFPKTSLPDLAETEKLVNGYTDSGDDVIIITISSRISGTHETIKNLFKDNPKVKVLDSKLAVGGIRFLVEDINRHRNLTLEELEKRVNELIPRIKVMAIPETLDYLLKGGRLAKTEWLFGTILGIKPIIGFKDGKVSAVAKKKGIVNGMRAINEYLNQLGVDEEYGIIASYTYDKTNLEKLISLTDEKYKNLITAYDDLDFAIAGHWGPNAFGYIFVAEK